MGITSTILWGFGLSTSILTIPMVISRYLFSTPLSCILSHTFVSANTVFLLPHVLFFHLFKNVSRYYSSLSPIQSYILHESASLTWMTVPCPDWQFSSALAVTLCLIIIWISTFNCWFHLLISLAQLPNQLYVLIEQMNMFIMIAQKLLESPTGQGSYINYCTLLTVKLSINIIVW